jgi:transcription antitermination protein NusB
MKAARRDPRRRAREIALQILYQWDVARTDVSTAADTYFDLQWAGSEAPPSELRTAATELAHDAVRRLNESDALIAEAAERWRPERMAVLDRLIMRMAIAELLSQSHGENQSHGESGGASRGGESTPSAVIINEALELARTFSSEESVKFINGMLDAIRKRIEAPKA